MSSAVGPQGRIQEHLAEEHQEHPFVPPKPQVFLCSQGHLPLPSEQPSQNIPGSPVCMFGHNSASANLSLLQRGCINLWLIEGSDPSDSQASKESSVVLNPRSW